MLRSRVIPSLLIEKGGLYKTEKFTNPKYVGDPINAVKIFNEKNVDELSIFDIGASKYGINFVLLERIAKEAQMPLLYGGGVQSASDARRLLQMGYEKISLNTSFLDNPNILMSIAQAIGSQSVVVSIDVKKGNFGGYKVFKNRGNLKVHLTLKEILKSIDFRSVGEVLINNISRDGTQLGIDVELIEMVRPLVPVHLTVLGGLSGPSEINDLTEKYYPIGIAGGACFTFKGPYKAVLLNYYRPK